MKQATFIFADVNIWGKNTYIGCPAKTIQYFCLMIIRVKPEKNLF